MKNVTLSTATDSTCMRLLGLAAVCSENALAVLYRRSPLRLHESSLLLLAPRCCSCAVLLQPDCLPVVSWQRFTECTAKVSGSCQHNHVQLDNRMVLAQALVER
jgi:hypothetical protein